MHSYAREYFEHLAVSRDWPWHWSSASARAPTLQTAVNKRETSLMDRGESLNSFDPNLRVRLKHQHTRNQHHRTSNQALLWREPLLQFQNQTVQERYRKCTPVIFFRSARIGIFAMSLPADAPGCRGAVLLGENVQNMRLEPGIQPATRALVADHIMINLGKFIKNTFFKSPGSWLRPC